MPSTDVLVAPSSSDASGVASYIAAMAAASLPAKATYLVVPGSDLERALPADTRIAPTTGTRLDMTRAIKETLGEHAIVQTHGARALLAARLARVPGARIHHFFHEHARTQGVRGVGELALSPGVRHVANSVLLAEHLRRYGIRSAAILPPLLATSTRLTRVEARQRLGVDESAPMVFGVVGGLTASKAPQMAIQAVACLSRPDQEHAAIVFVGDGPCAADLRDLGARTGVEVILPGRVPGAAALMRAFDVVIVPCSHETFGIAMAEAALAEVPIAATRSIGARTLTNDGSLLRLAEPTPEGLASGISRARRLSGMELGRLKSFVAERFASERALDRYREYFSCVSNSVRDARELPG